MKTKRILCMALALALVLSMALAGCGEKKPTSSAPVSSEPASSEPVSSEATSSEPVSSTPAVDDGEIDVDAHEAASAEVYEQILGEFNTIYTEAVAELENIPLRYAKMAIAEAKALEAGVMYPNQAGGGNYRIARIAPHGGNYTTSGADGDKYYRAVITNEPIKAADYNEIKGKWSEMRGTGKYREYLLNALTEKGYTLKDSYNLNYNGNPETWDLLATSMAADSVPVVQTCDALMEHDCEGTLQPALAESYEVSEDGLTYTFHIRKGVKWVDNQGREVADVKADDWVAGLQHMMDAMGGLEYLVDGLIVNASEYMAGTVTDFSEVGVSAPDDNTLVYTLTKPTYYFPSMLTYSIFYPMSRSFYESKGGTFGEEYDEGGSGDYGMSPENIAYCGPMLITGFTPNNTIVWNANESYWNPDALSVHSITYLYNDGSDPQKYYTDFLAGTVDGVVLNAESLESSKKDGNFETYAHITDTDTGSYPTLINVKRLAFANAKDNTKVVSPKSQEEKDRTAAAMLNVHFRRALATSVDRVNYRAQFTGSLETASLNLMNSYTPWNFVSLDEEVTVDINGTATTFPKGTWYGQIVQAQIDADGLPIKVYDPTADNGNGAGTGYDGWYNPEFCASEMAVAAEELADLNISAENPIQIDYPVVTSNSAYLNRGQALKKSVEASSNGMIQVNIVECGDVDQWRGAAYNTAAGYESNYDISDLSGWSPDYDDPSTYLDTLLPDGAGYMTKCFGLW